MERESVGNKVSKILLLERCNNCCDNEDTMLRMPTGYHGILEKLHSCSTPELFIQKTVFLPPYQATTDSFSTARAPPPSSKTLFTAAAAQAESGISA